MGRFGKIARMAGVAATAYLSKKENREKLKRQLNKMMKKINSSSNASTIKNLGKSRD